MKTTYKEWSRIGPWLIMLALWWTPAQLRAGVIYSNVGAGYPGDATTSYATVKQFFGTTFTTTSGGNLSALSIGLNSDASPLTIGLYMDSSGQPGALLESWDATVPGPASTGQPHPPLTTITSVLNPLLLSGTQYWVVLTQIVPPPKGTPEVVWFANDQGVAGGVWGGTSLNPLTHAFASNLSPGIELDSTSTSTVPEPSSGMLLATAVVLMTLACSLSGSLLHWSRFAR